MILISKSPKFCFCLVFRGLRDKVLILELGLHFFKGGYSPTLPFDKLRDQGLGSRACRGTANKLAYAFALAKKEDYSPPLCFGEQALLRVPSGCFGEEQ